MEFKEVAGKTIRSMSESEGLIEIQFTDDTTFVFKFSVEKKFWLSSIVDGEPVPAWGGA
jgi:hypothetical protein